MIDKERGDYDLVDKERVGLKFGGNVDDKN